MAAIPETHVNVTAQSSYPTDPQLTIPYIPDWLCFVDLSTTAIVHFSFDGKTDHGYINPAFYPMFIWPGERKFVIDKVWIRRDAPGVDTVVVVVTGATDS